MSAPELTEVRAPIDLDGLRTYLSKVSNSTPETQIGYNAQVPRSFQTIKQFTFGQSNPTYYLEDDQGRSFVLRRKPSANAKLIQRSAHAIEREFFILNAINMLNQDAELKIPVPQVHLLCEDEGVIGYVFYLMEYVNGIQLKNPSLPEFSPEAPERQVIWESIIQTIAAIHLLDAEQLIKLLPASHFPQFQNLDKLRNTTYFQRQIKTLGAIHKKQSTHVDKIPNWDKITEFLLQNAPSDPSKLSLIHGDCKIDNFLFDPKTYKVSAVLDWELCTIGHPLFDLSNFLQPYGLPQQFNAMLYKTKPNKLSLSFGMEDPSSQQFLRKQLQNYNKLVTWDTRDPQNNPLDKWNVGHVFGLLRLSVISQGIAMRVKMGNASSALAEQYAKMYPYLSQLATDVIYEQQKQEKHKGKL